MRRGACSRAIAIVTGRSPIRSPRPNRQCATTCWERSISSTCSPNRSYASPITGEPEPGVRPVVTPAEMGEADRRTISDGTPEVVLVERAAHAVAAHALRMLGGAYGRRVVVVCG